MPRAKKVNTVPVNPQILDDEVPEEPSYSNDREQDTSDILTPSKTRKPGGGRPKGSKNKTPKEKKGGIEWGKVTSSLDRDEEMPWELGQPRNPKETAKRRVEVAQWFDENVQPLVVVASSWVVGCKDEWVYQLNPQTMTPMLTPFGEQLRLEPKSVERFAVAWTRLEETTIGAVIVNFFAPWMPVLYMGMFVWSLIGHGRKMLALRGLIQEQIKAQQEREGLIAGGNAPKEQNATPQAAPSDPVTEVPQLEVMEAKA